LGVPQTVLSPRSDSEYEAIHYILFAVSWVFNKSGKTKISNLDIHFAIQEYIPEFQVSMYDLMCVHPFACTNELD
jgi:hypothetical protein